jgi:hypothetical protein
MRVTIAVRILLICALSQSATSRAQNVVRTMLPDGNIRRLVMSKPSDRERIIQQLRAVQATAQEGRAQEVAFLLAVLGSDCERNRDYLLWVMKGCEVSEIKHGCNDMTGDYLIYLYKTGHTEILAPLLSSSANNYNAAGSESLGSFMSEVVVKSPEDFLDAIRSFPPSKQERVCSLAGTAEGGGMALTDLRSAQKELGTMNDEIARRCLRQIERANKPAQK